MSTEYEIEKVKHVAQLFLNMIAHQKYIWSSGEKKQYLSIYIFHKFQDKPDIHLDF